MAKPAVGTGVKVENLDAMRRVVRDAGGKEFEKELGQVHKQVGSMVINHAGGKQTGVGEGAGSTMRPSATTREVVIRVGGSHRDENAEQWGKQQTWPPPERPNIIGSAEDIQNKIEDAYLDGVEQIFRRLPG